MSATAQPGARVACHMPADAHLDDLTLRVRDLDRLRGFYADTMGLRIWSRGADRLTLGPESKALALELVHDPQVPVRPRPSIGLYHFALLLPDRPALAAVVRRLLEAKWPLEGASDHGVSEALYLRDPEGNGIELYRDRPREAWPGRPGGVEMYSRALDVAALLDEAPDSAPLHPGTRLGHIHLHVDDLEAGERFYSTTLGLNVTQRNYSGALFLAAGDYHHHLGLNTWAHGRRAPGDATGLLRYGWVTPSGTVQALAAHLRAQGVPHERDGARLIVVDPFGIRVEVRDA